MFLSPHTKGGGGRGIGFGADPIVVSICEISLEPVNRFLSNFA